MRFRYIPMPVRHPVFPLGGIQTRYRPLLPIEVAGPLESRMRDVSLDSGSDDTLFPAHLAPGMGIDLTSAPEGQARSIGGVPIRYRYAPAKLRLTESYEVCEWEAIVGFISAPMRWAILGHAGALQFFDVQLLGARREVVLTPNSSFPGRYSVHRQP